METVNTSNENRDRIIKYCREHHYAGEHRPLAFASIFLNHKHCEALLIFYTFFCYCDDELDQMQSKEQAKAKLQRFWNYYNRIVKREAITFEENPPFTAIQYAISTYAVPFCYFENFLACMEMDINNHVYQSIDDLILYCYLATCLGLAASAYVAGVNNEDGIHYALYYGIGGQLANIARDILIDAEIDRIYVPIDWLKEAHVPPGDMTNPIYREQLHAIGQRLARLAEKIIKRGDPCLAFYSFSTACSLSLMRELDISLCHAICTRDTRRWENGISISLGRKVCIVPIAIARVIKAQGFRLFKKFKPVTINRIWDFEAQHGKEGLQ